MVLKQWMLKTLLMNCHPFLDLCSVRKLLVLWRPEEDCYKSHFGFTIDDMNIDIDDVKK